MCVFTSLLQHHTQWSFYRSNQTSFMTIWIGMNDTSMVLLVYVPVWSFQGRNCNQKWTFTGSVWFNLQLYFNITPYEASVDPTKLLLWLFGLVWMILVWVCKYMFKFAQSRAGTVIENLIFSQVRKVQHDYIPTPHSRSFCRSNQTSFMTI